MPRRKKPAPEESPPDLQELVDKELQDLEGKSDEGQEDAGQESAGSGDEDQVLQDEGSEPEGDESQSEELHDGEPEPDDEGAEEELSSGDDEDGEQEQVDPVVEYTRQLFISQGYDENIVNSLSKEELQSELSNFVAQGPAKQEAQQRQQQQPPPNYSREESSEEKAEKQEKTKETKRRQRQLKKLAYDHNLEEYVEINNGIATPKDGTGQVGMDAAASINSYADDYRRRSKDLITDPIATLEPDLDAFIEARLDKRLAEFEAGLESQRTEAEAQQSALSEQQAFNAFMEENSSQIYVTGEDGQPRKSLRTGDFVFTEYGEQLESVYLELVETNPQAPHSQLLTKAKGRDAIICIVKEN